MVRFAASGFGLTLRTLAVALCVGLCVGLRTPAEGEPQLIGSLQPIIAAPGDDVILPCHLEPDFNVEGLAVEWSKPDLKPEPADRPSRPEYVHLYRNRGEDPDMKLPSYVSRTLWRSGNVSLKIMNVTLADEGRYRCFIPRLKSKVKESVVELVIDPNDETNVEGGRPNQTALISAAVCVILILAGFGVGYLLKHKCRKIDLTQRSSVWLNQTLEESGVIGY